MTLVRKSINGNEYFTDDKVYYTFHQVNAATDTLWGFACKALGITRQTGFNSQETKDITDLAGIGPIRPTRFLLLKNGDAVPVPYLPNGSPGFHTDDIILRTAVSPVAPAVTRPVSSLVPPSNSTRSVADRLKEIEDLHNGSLITDQEYQDARGKLIAEL